MGAANRLTQTNRKFVFIQQTKMRKNAVTESSHILGSKRTKQDSHYYVCK